jgi:hypothetical protein
MGGFSDFLLGGSSQNEQRIHNPNSASRREEQHLGVPLQTFRLIFLCFFTVTTVMMTFGAQRFELQHDEKSATGVAPCCFRKARDNPAPFSVEPYDFY